MGDVTFTLSSEQAALLAPILRKMMLGTEKESEKDQQPDPPASSADSGVMNDSCSDKSGQTDGSLSLFRAHKDTGTEVTGTAAAVDSNTDVDDALVACESEQLQYTAEELLSKKKNSYSTKAQNFFT